ncbi:hypothetical protein [Burkholderia cepacia]|uniref:hypothetical protein n=1 Tax=Burkholderia cepacia TaxID=292 RepID=UPI002AB747FF|nr:hypothetical protein [Burkholderia cepacia]
MKSSRLKNLSDAAIQWLANGERGISSETMFTKLTGVKCLKRGEMSHPLDPSDFRRCRLLLDACPQLRDKLPKMRKLSPAWRALVRHWAELEALMDEEIPRWRKSSGSAPRTHQRMTVILGTVPTR